MALSYELSFHMQSLVESVWNIKHITCCFFAGSSRIVDRETLDSYTRLIITNYRAISLSDSCLVLLRLPVVAIPSTSSCFNKF